jgi:hypothetical protein
MRKTRALAIALLFMGVGTVTFAQTPQPTPAKSGKKYVATRQIIFDKTTGQLRLPTTEETVALVDHITRLTNHSPEDLPVTQEANGMKSVHLGGRFGGVVLGRALADGTTEVRCVMTMQEATEFLGLEESTPQQ